MPTDQLLLDFLTTDLPLTELARRHNLSLPDLLAWADSAGTQKIFDDLARIARQRSTLIAAESSVKALGNLAQLSLALARRSELANLPGGPKPPSITALETSRKACATLLRILPKPGAMQDPPDRANPASARGHRPTTTPSSRVPETALSRPASPVVRPSRATDNPLPVHSLSLPDHPNVSVLSAPLSPLQPSTLAPSHPTRLVSLAGTNPLSPSPSRLSSLPSAGIPPD